MSVSAKNRQVLDQLPSNNGGGELMGITPKNTVLVVLCFEGPDNYSMAGGLGDKITHLTSTLADLDLLLGLREP